MSNGTRHLLGVITGIVAIPVVSALAFGGLTLQLQAYARLTQGAQLYSAVGVLAVGAIVVALLVGTRISPLASLIPGLAFTAGGVLIVAMPRTILALANDLPEARITVDPLPPASLASVVVTGLTSGACLLVGVVLLFASLAPSRWRGTAGTRLATSAGLHRADPDAEEPRFPPLPPERPEFGEPRGPGLPSDETSALPEQQPYGSGPQSPYGGSGPQSPVGGAEPPTAAFSGQGAPLSAPWPEERYGAPEPRSPLGGSGPQGPYGGGEPQEPYRSAFDPPDRPRAEDGPSGYAPGYRPSSWSGPQAPFPAEPGRPPQPAGEDPYGTPPRYASSSPDPQPWGPAPETDPAPVRDFFNDPSARSGRTDPPGSNAEETTNRMPWTEDDRSRFRDPRDPYDR